MCRTFSFSRASLIGRVVRGMEATVLFDSSAMADVYVQVQLVGIDAALDVMDSFAGDGGRRAWC